MRVYGLILAAGMSRRMQDFKPLMKMGNATVIETVLDRMLDAGVDCATVVLGYRGRDVQEVLEKDKRRKGRISYVYNHRYEHSQMMESIQCGLAQMGDCSGFFLVPGDMPGISADTYRTMLKIMHERNADVIFPVVDGRRKHPPFIQRSCIEPILAFQEDGGMRAFWEKYRGKIVEIPLDDRGCTMDMDYREDYERLYRYVAGESVKQNY